MRIDRLLVYLRIVRTRSRAAELVAEGHLRRNGVHVCRASEDVRPGDVLTIPVERQIRILEILALPQRRGPPLEARSHYRELDRSGESAIAGAKATFRRDGSA